jgi:hypothetical protein
MTRGTIVFAALILLWAGGVSAQVGSPPAGTSMGVPGSNNPGARPSEMGEHDSASLASTVDQMRHGTQQADADRAAARARSGGRAVPATAADIVAMAPVSDTAGQPLGTIESVDADGAVIVTAAGKVKVPLNAFGKNKKGLLVGVTKADFEALVAKANATPAG